MSERAGAQPSFFAWVREPQTLVGLSALLLSLCGLFVAVYEASLMRAAQRASVWPHVQVNASLSAEQTRIWVENTGVGPARIRAAAVIHEGETLATWADLLRTVAGRAGVDHVSITTYFSLITGQVLPTTSPETIFSITPESGPGAAEVMARLRQAVLQGSVDVRLCYCSVYEECWISSVQDVVRLTRGEAAVREGREVENCESAPRSGI